MPRRGKKSGCLVRMTGCPNERRDVACTFAADSLNSSHFFSTQSALFEEKNVPLQVNNILTWAVCHNSQSASLLSDSGLVMYFSTLPAPSSSAPCILAILTHLRGVKPKCAFWHIAQPLSRTEKSFFTETPSWRRADSSLFLGALLVFPRCAPSFS